MKTKNIPLMFWASLALILAAAVAWSVFHRVAAASSQPGFSRGLWIIPLVVVLVSFLGAGTAVWLEKSPRVQLFALKSFAVFAPVIVAPIVLTEDQIGLIGYLAVTGASVAITLFGSFWFGKRVKLMREEDGHHCQSA